MARAFIQSLIPDDWENLNFSVSREQAQHLRVDQILDRGESKWQITHLDQDYINTKNVIVRADRYALR